MIFLDWFSGATAQGIGIGSIVLLAIVGIFCAFSRYWDNGTMKKSLKEFNEQEINITLLFKNKNLNLIHKDKQEENSVSETATVKNTKDKISNKTNNKKVVQKKSSIKVDKSKECFQKGKKQSFTLISSSSDGGSFADDVKKGKFSLKKVSKQQKQL